MGQVKSLCVNFISSSFIYQTPQLKEIQVNLINIYGASAIF